jgi:hypothetical protein
MPRQEDREYLEKIPDDEPVFILLGRDKLALQTVAFYRDTAIQNGVNRDKIDRVIQHIRNMIEFRDEHSERIKLPD